MIDEIVSDNNTISYIFYRFISVIKNLFGSLHVVSKGDWLKCTFASKYAGKRRDAGSAAGGASSGADAAPAAPSAPGTPPRAAAPDASIPASCATLSCCRAAAGSAATGSAATCHGSAHHATIVKTLIFVRLTNVH